MLETGCRSFSLLSLHVHVLYTYLYSFFLSIGDLFSPQLRLLRLEHDSHRIENGLFIRFAERTENSQTKRCSPQYFFSAHSN